MSSFRFFLSRTAHESAAAYYRRAAGVLSAYAGFERRPVARGVFVVSPAGVVVGYVAYSV